MEYKITEQYARGEEKPIAEFIEINDANIFMIKKLVNNDLENKKIVYRIYDDSELLQEFNKDNILIAYAQYADGNSEISSVIGFLFNIMMSNTSSLDRIPIANFNDRNDANLFIACKCESTAVTDSDLFFIYKGRDLIDTSSRVIINHRAKESEGSSSNEKGAKFRPTPMPSRPTPPGGPSDYWVEDDDKDN